MAADPAPPSVVAIRAARDSLARHRRAAVAAAAAAVLLCWLGSGLFLVGHDETAARLRWGRLVGDAEGPGLGFRVPGVEEMRVVRSAEVRRLPVASDFTPDLDLVSGDENLIAATVVVQLRIRRLGDYLFAVEDPEELVRQTVRAMLVEAVAGLGVDDILTAGKAEIQNRVRGLAQEQLDRQGAGVALVAVGLQTIAPPGEADAAFREVVDARAEAARIVSDARAARDRTLGLARAGAARIEGEAAASAAARIEQAGGAAERFVALAARHRADPALARIDLRRAALRRALPRTRVIVLAPGASRIDLQLLEDGARPAVVSPAPTPPGGFGDHG
jgi:regulator of protease activity HflC (stomatin/prohibitin superfamily)